MWQLVALAGEELEKKYWWIEKEGRKRPRPVRQGSRVFRITCGYRSCREWYYCCHGVGKVFITNNGDPHYGNNAKKTQKRFCKGRRCQ